MTKQKAKVHRPKAPHLKEKPKLTITPKPLSYYVRAGIMAIQRENREKNES